MKTRKNAIQCLRDIVRLNPPAECFARANDRKKVFNGTRRYTLLLQLASYANPDGTEIRPAVTTLANTLRWGRSTIYRELSVMQELGFIMDVGIHEETGARQWTIDMVGLKEAVKRAVPDRRQSDTGVPVPDSQGCVPDSQGTVPDSQGTVPDRGDTPAVPSYRPSKQPSYRPYAGSGLFDSIVSGSESPTTKDDTPSALTEKPSSIVIPTPDYSDPLGGGTLSPEALAKKAAREAAEEAAKWRVFDSKKEWLDFVMSEASRMDETVELVTEFLPGGIYRVTLQPMMPSYRGKRFVGYVPNSLRDKKTRIGDNLYICRYGKCENLAGELSLYCTNHEGGYERSGNGVYVQ